MIEITLIHHGAAEARLEASRSADELRAGYRALVEGMQETSQAMGMRLDEGEIRDQSWGHVAAKLVALSRSPATDHDAAARAFIERGLAFLAHMAFRHPPAKARITLDIAPDGQVEARLEPAPMVGRARVALGNYKAEQASASAVLGQAGA